MGLSKIAHYTEHISPAGLAGAKLWPWYTSNYYNSSTALMDLGAEWDLVGPRDAAGGNSFMYVKAASGVSFTEGQLCSFATPTAGTVAAGTTKTAITWNSAAFTAGAEVGNFVYVANSTASGGGFTLRKIVANTTTILTVSLTDPNVASKPNDQNAFEEIPTTGDVAIVIRPYQVIVNTATTVPIGVVLGTVTAGYYTIVQTKGLALVSSVGNGTALAVGVPAVGAAAGVAIGGNGTASAYCGPKLIPQSVYSAAGPGLTPFLINLKANL